MKPLLPQQPVTMGGDRPSRELVEVIQRIVEGVGTVVVPDGVYGEITVTGASWTVNAGAIALDELSDVVLTAPANGQLLTYNGTNWVNQAPAVAGGVTLLGTITTTSGTSQSLTSLTLTGYKFLRLVFVGVSTGGSSGDITVDNRAVALIGATGNTLRGMMEIDLTDGVFVSNVESVGVNASAAGDARVGDCSITTASTSVDVATTVNVFDAGSVRVYGIA